MELRVYTVDNFGFEEQGSVVRYTDDCVNHACLLGRQTVNGEDNEEEGQDLVGHGLMQTWVVGRGKGGLTYASRFIWNPRGDSSAKQMNRRRLNQIGRLGSFRIFVRLLNY